MKNLGFSPVPILAGFIPEDRFELSAELLPKPALAEALLICPSGFHDELYTTAKNTGNGDHSELSWWFRANWMRRLVHWITARSI